MSAPSTVAAFQSSGVDFKDITLLLGSLGELNRIITEAKSYQQRSSNPDEDEDNDITTDEEPFVPVTFGAKDAIYGAKVGKADFSSKYLSNLIKKKGDSNDELGQVLLNIPQCLTFIQKYKDNDKGFVNDVREAYLRLTSLGEQYTNRNS